MPSSFDGRDLFGSGPHRVERLPVGLRVIANAELTGDPRSPGSTTQGPLEAELLISGRLVAASPATLRSLRNALTSRAADPTPARLVEPSGETHEQMTLLRFAEMGPVDRGRALSVAYEARFRRLSGAGA